MADVNREPAHGTSPNFYDPSGPLFKGTGGGKKLGYVSPKSEKGGIPVETVDAGNQHTEQEMPLVGPSVYNDWEKKQPK